jgi:hypothetical protein
MLAAVTALSLGVGTAMAQSQVPSAAEGGYFSGQHEAAPQTTNNGLGQVQSGSSDVTPTHPGATGIPNWQSLPNFTDPG